MKYFFCPIRLIVVLFIIVNLVSCAAGIGMVVISKPDEYSHLYEANEKIILKAIAGVFKEKNIGANVTIDQKNHRIDSDYVVAGDKPGSKLNKAKTLGIKIINEKEFIEMLNG